MPSGKPVKDNVTLDENPAIGTRAISKVPESPCCKLTCFGEISSANVDSFGVIVNWDVVFFELVAPSANNPYNPASRVGIVIVPLKFPVLVVVIVPGETLNPLVPEDNPLNFKVILSLAANPLPSTDTWLSVKPLDGNVETPAFPLSVICKVKDSALTWSVEFAPSLILYGPGLRLSGMLNVTLNNCGEPGVNANTSSLPAIGSFTVPDTIPW